MPQVALGRERNNPLLAIDRRDRHDIVPPIAAGKDKQLALFTPAPIPGVFLFVLERAMAFVGDFLPHTDRLAVGIGPPTTVGILWIVVRPAGQVLSMAVEEQLAEVDALQSLGGHRGLEDRIAVGNESGNGPAADEACLLCFCGAVDDGRVGRAGIRLAELKRVCEEIRPAAQDDGDTAGRQRSGLLHLANPIPGAVQRGQRAVGLGGVGCGERSRPSIVAAQSDKDRCPRLHAGCGS